MLQAFRKAIGVRIKEETEIIEGEVNYLCRVHKEGAVLLFMTHIYIFFLVFFFIWMQANLLSITNRLFCKRRTDCHGIEICAA